MAFNLVNYSQQDPAWQSVKIGKSSETIGHVGCALTSLAMLVSGHGYPETPKTLNAKLKSRGGYVEAAIIWGAVTGIYPQIVYRNLVLCRDTNAPLAQIDASIAKGQPVLVEVDSSPKAGLQTHWVVLYKKQGDDYLMLDPWPYPTESGQEVPLMARYSHGKPLKKSITAAIFYECVQSGSGDSGETATTKPTLPTEAGTYVKIPVSVEAGLRLRSGPTTASTTVAVEPPGADLLVLEPVDVVTPKIGVYNQWIHVRDGGGREGYVAAWYVERGSTVEGAEEPEITEAGPVESEPPVPPAPVTPEPVSDSQVEPTPVPEPEPPVSESLSVYVSSAASAGLRLRSEPNTNSSTLMILPAGSELKVQDGTSDMIGVYGKWLKVREGGGMEGYVAAWYVRK